MAAAFPRRPEELEDLCHFETRDAEFGRPCPRCARGGECGASVQDCDHCGGEGRVYL